MYLRQTSMARCEYSNNNSHVEDDNLEGDKGVSVVVKVEKVLVPKSGDREPSPVSVAE